MLAATKIQKQSAAFSLLLKEIPDCPKELYCIGNGSLLKEKYLISIVGSRRATSYGLHQSEGIAYQLARSGVVVVSGMAIGVDGAAHRGALKAKGKTIAVLGTAINKFYPQAHMALARQILSHGGLIISEYEPDAPFYKENFLARNRIIAGISQATIVTEAAERSGALVTAAYALDYNRDVFSVPGDVDRLNSVGTNALIKKGAFCLTSAKDVLNALEIEEGKLALVDLPKEEKAILEIVKSGQISFDEILKKSKAKPADLNSSLLRLEIKGMIKSTGTGEYHNI